MGVSQVRVIAGPQVIFHVPVNIRRAVGHVQPAVSGPVNLGQQNVEHILLLALRHHHRDAVLQVARSQENEGIFAGRNLFQTEVAAGIGPYLRHPFGTLHQAHAGMLYGVTVGLGQHASFDTAGGGFSQQEGRPQKGGQDTE